MGVENTFPTLLAVCLDVKILTVLVKYWSFCYSKCIVSPYAENELQAVLHMAGISVFLKIINQKFLYSELVSQGL